MKDARLDQYLFQQGLAPSRERAHALIMAGIVYVNGAKADKAGTPVREGALVEVRGKDLAYVSRGGLKLEKALQVFPIELQAKVCMDIGASTGGFTDCMLQNGAAKVYAVDVGYGQLAWSLRCDARVVNLERTNIRNVTPAEVAEKIDFFSVDVSFISLKHIFPVAAALAAENAHGVCLVKPQFEAGREKVGKKGVVREAETHAEVIANAMEYAVQNGFAYLGLNFSPIKGPEGNIEFLLHVCRGGTPAALPMQAVLQTVEQAHKALRQGSGV
ncbi:MAG: TlyA family RNA methyltransferase [Oscillospiraceae bacterium]